MKLFENMNEGEQLSYLRKLHVQLPRLLRDYLREPIVDIWDWNDHWIPFLLYMAEKKVIKNAWSTKISIKKD